MTGETVRWYGVGLGARTLATLAGLPGWIPMGLARDVPAAPPREPVDLWLLEGEDLRDTLRRGKALQPLLGEGRLCVLVPSGAAAEVWRAAVEAVIGPAPAVRTVCSLDELAGLQAATAAIAGGASPIPPDGTATPRPRSGADRESPVNAGPDAGATVSVRAGDRPRVNPWPAGGQGGGRDTIPVLPVRAPRWANPGLPPAITADRLPGQPEATGGVVAVVGPKGGVGRTWLSCELAAVMAAAGAPVGLVDADWVGGDAAVHLDLTGGPTILDLQPLLDGPPEDWEEQWMVHPRTGLRFLAAPPRPELASLVEPGVLEPILARARQRFRMTLVDCPAGERQAVGEAGWLAGWLPQVDRLLLVTTPAPTSLRQARAWLEEWYLQGDGRGPRVDIVVNRWAQAGPERQALEDYLGYSVAAWLPDDAAAVESAIAAGVPLVLAQPSHPLATAVRDLAGRLLGQELPGRPGGRRGFWHGLADRVRGLRAGGDGRITREVKGRVG